MPPKVKRTYTKKAKATVPDSPKKKEETECEKENEGLEKKCEPILKAEEKKDTLLKSPLKEKENLKPTNFWRQKLKELEPEMSLLGPKKRGLYEFSGTDTEESASPYKRKKKVKQKQGPRKIKQPVKKNPVQKPVVTKLVKKIQQVHNKSLFKEQSILKKEREKLADKGKKFTFSTGMSSLGITSTPAVNRDNFVGASNFLFLSPIMSEEIPSDKAPELVTPKKSEKSPEKPVVFETPKLPERRFSYRKVLRNGKVV